MVPRSRDSFLSQPDSWEVKVWYYSPPPCPAGVLPVVWAMACDVEWFEHHPGARDYWRQVIPGEASLEGTGLAEPCCAWRMVHVSRIAEGMRTRHFVHVWGTAA